MIVIAQHFGDFANRQAQTKQLLDSLPVLIKLFGLNSTWRLTQADALDFLRGQRLFGAHTDQVPLHFGKRREQGDDNLRAHVMPGDVQFLLDDDKAHAALDQLLDQGNDLGRTPPKPAQLGDDQRIEIAELFHQLVNSALLAGLPRRNGDFVNIIL